MFELAIGPDGALYVAEGGLGGSHSTVGRCRQVPAVGPYTGSTHSRALGPILSLAQGQALSAYDAAYLDLAIHDGLPLATRDKALRRAARALGVPLA